MFEPLLAMFGRSDYLPGLPNMPRFVNIGAAGNPRCFQVECLSRFSVMLGLRKVWLSELSMFEPLFAVLGRADYLPGLPSMPRFVNIGARGDARCFQVECLSTVSLMLGLRKVWLLELPMFEPLFAVLGRANYLPGLPSMPRFVNIGAAHGPRCLEEVLEEQKSLQTQLDLLKVEKEEWITLFKEENKKCQNSRQFGQPLRAQVDEVLKKNGIDCTMQHGGKLKGNQCRKLLSASSDIL